MTRALVATIDTNSFSSTVIDLEIESGGHYSGSYFVMDMDILEFEITVDGAIHFYLMDEDSFNAFIKGESYYFYRHEQVVNNYSIINDFPPVGIIYYVLYNDPGDGYDTVTLEFSFYVTNLLEIATTTTEYFYQPYEYDYSYNYESTPFFSVTFTILVIFFVFIAFFVVFGYVIYRAGKSNTYSGYSSANNWRRSGYYGKTNKTRDENRTVLRTRSYHSGAVTSGERAVSGSFNAQVTFNRARSSFTFCVECGTKMERDDNFCMNCGTRVRK